MSFLELFNEHRQKGCEHCEQLRVSWLAKIEEQTRKKKEKDQEAIKLEEQKKADRAAETLEYEKKNGIQWMIEEPKPGYKQSIWHLNFERMETSWSLNPWGQGPKILTSNWKTSEPTLQILKENGNNLVIYNKSVEHYLFENGFAVVGGSTTSGNLQFDKIDTIKIYRRKNNEEKEEYLCAYFATGKHKVIRDGKKRIYTDVGEVTWSADTADNLFYTSYDGITRFFLKLYANRFHSTLTLQEFSDKIKNELWSELSEKEKKELILSSIR